MSANTTTSLLIKKDESLWGWGSNGFRQIHPDGQDKLVPISIANGVKQACTGEGHILYLKNNGELYGVGRNYEGQLGIGSNTTYESEHKLIMVGIKSIACTSRGSLAVSEIGEVWAWGSNEYGQLGFGTSTPVNTPQKTEENVKHVFAGDFNSFILKNDDSLWGCGYNDRGRVGSGDLSANLLSYRQIMTGVSKFSGGASSFFSVKKDNSLWAWGTSSNGSLGVGVTNGVFPTPEKIMENVKECFTGANSSFVIDMEGNAYATGRNYDGQLGIGSISDKSVLTYVVAEVTEISGGLNHTIFIMEDGRVLGVGKNDRGQIGDNTLVSKSTPVLVDTEGMFLFNNMYIKPVILKYLLRKEGKIKYYKDNQWHTI